MIADCCILQRINIIIIIFLFSVKILKSAIYFVYKKFHWWCNRGKNREVRQLGRIKNIGWRRKNDVEQKHTAGDWASRGKNTTLCLERRAIQGIYWGVISKLSHCMRMCVNKTKSKIICIVCAYINILHALRNNTYNTGMYCARLYIKILHSKI